MKTRCKFKVDWVKQYGVHYEDVSLSAVHGGTKENESFASATPSGTLTFTVTNPNVIGKFNPGQEVYLDLTPFE